MDKLDYKKKYKALYQPKIAPVEIEVPPMVFIMIDGMGDPNQAGGEYQKAVGVLYALSYTIKMSKLGGVMPAGYFEYVVPPLEGLWHLAANSAPGAFFVRDQKDKFCWTSMIRQPEFVTEEVFRWACIQASGKKPEIAADLAGIQERGALRLETFCEGLCVQAMHLGPYDEEPATLKKMHAFMRERGLADDVGAVLSDGTVRRHHEIYLNDPRRTTPEKYRTVLRVPVRRG